MSWERSTKIMQFFGALVAIPAALGGAYSVWHNQFSAEGACESLRNKVFGIIDRNVAADVKLALAHKDVDEFNKKCADIDPDVNTIFQATMNQLQRPARTGASPSQAARVDRQSRVAAVPSSEPSHPADSAAHSPSGPIFGLSPSGERHGWVVLNWRNPKRDTVEINFDGLADTSPPSVGARLSARRAMPIWLEPQRPGPIDMTRLQGRIGRGGCVEVLATRTAAQRLWAEVAPVDCH